ncbi:MAG: hypothetical protein KIT68_02395 [Phycisphaeraceae bacterium]|nr:hypothetical protein [Phycisphaeraceae bacterium]
MRLTDVMSSMDLAVYPALALVLFTGVFALVAIRVARTRREEAARWSSLPLDETPTNPEDRR